MKPLLVQYVTLIVIASSMLCINGCSSIMTRVGPYQGYYPGAKVDVQMLKDDSGWVMTPLAILDLPFSTLLDTLLLPYDYYHSTQDPTKESPKARLMKKKQNDDDQ